MRVHNPEYQPPVTSGSRVTGCINFGLHLGTMNSHWTYNSILNGEKI